MLIYVLRHGETDWNRVRRFQGSSDVELNEKGIELAKVTGEALKDVPFDICYTSTLKRAKLTAKCVIGDRDIPVIEDARICEINCGEWEGKIAAGENMEIPKEAHRIFFEDPFNWPVPKGAESIQQIIDRAGSFLNEIINKKELQDKTILVSTHGCCTRALLNPLYDDPKDFWQGRVPPNCSVNIIEVKDGKAKIIEKDKIFYDASLEAPYHKFNKKEQ